MTVPTQFDSIKDPRKAGQKKSILGRLWQDLKAFIIAPPGEPTFRESIEEIIEGHDEGALPGEVEERTMFRNLLDFGRLDVADVMVPRADILSVQESVTLNDLIALICEHGHSRVPVHRGSLDDVIGMVHIRDVLAFWGRSDEFQLFSVVRSLLFVPPSMPIQELLLEMRATKIHMALVVDEFGGTDGLVTIEDLVEEIVGEIEDEHDRTIEPRLTDRPDGLLDADARVLVSDLEAKCGVDLLSDERSEEIGTLGGLVCELAGRVPLRGELIAHPSGMVFEIVDADPRKIRRLRVHPNLDYGDEFSAPNKEA